MIVAPFLTSTTREVEMVDSNSGDLLARIQRLEDLDAIQRTWHDYMLALDSRRWEDLADVFTDDGVVEMIGLDRRNPDADGIYPGGGEAIVRDFYAAVTSGGGPAATLATGHNGSNMSIDLDGDEAITSTYFWEIVGGSTLLVGTYQHRFRRDPDRWRMAFLRIRITYSCRLEASDVWAKPLGVEPLQPVPGA
jgi:SnoaL-like domain